MKRGSCQAESEIDHWPEITVEAFELAQGCQGGFIPDFCLLRKFFPISAGFFTDHFTSL
jgi:hypothetical protein